VNNKQSASLRVLVTGSAKRLDSEGQKRFCETCERIGKWLASEGHVLLIAGTVVPYADHYVANAFLSELPSQQGGRQRLILYYAVNDETSTASSNPLLDRIRQAPSLCGMVTGGGHEYSPAYVRALEQANVVLALGGGSSVELICSNALIRQLPVLSFSCFGGAARDFYNRIYRNYELSGHLEATTLLSEPLQDNHRENFLELVQESPSLSSPTDTMSGGPVASTVATALVVLVCAWLFGPNSTVQWIRLLSLFLVPMAGGVMGMSLRLLLRERRGVYWSRKEWITALVAGPAIGVSVVFFAFAHLALTGHFKSDFFEPGVENFRLLTISSVVAAVALGWLSRPPSILEGMFGIAEK
jgi:hypothetical protein